MMQRPWYWLALFAAAWFGLAPEASAEVWDREIAPGILFRMERQADPQLNIYGLRIDPRRLRVESEMARKTVYDATPTNGRDVISGMVRSHEAIGGVNGDFFQFGNDPGGDPMNLMVQDGELFSQPGKAGNRGFAVGWGPKAAWDLGAAEWEAHYSVNGGAPQAIQTLNARLVPGAVTLCLDSVGFVYAGPEVKEALMVRVQAGSYRLSPQGKIEGVVSAVSPLQGRMEIPKGEFVLTGAGPEADAFRALKPGDKIRVEVRVTGFDWKKIKQVIGGGPLLLKAGENVLPKRPIEFNDIRNPRTAMGRTADGNLWFVVVDGRQAMSVGVNMADLAEIMRRWGCVDAMNLDGGGSSTVNLFGLTLNRPSGGIERAVANGVLFYGSKPKAGNKKVTIRLPEGPLVVGKTAQVEVLEDGVPVPVAKVVFAAQGGGWIDQNGLLTLTKMGSVEIAVLVNGVITSVRSEVSP